MPAHSVQIRGCRNEQQDASGKKQERHHLTLIASQCAIKVSWPSNSANINIFL